MDQIDYNWVSYVLDSLLIDLSEYLLRPCGIFLYGNIQPKRLNRTGVRSKLLQYEKHKRIDLINKRQYTI